MGLCHAFLGLGVERETNVGTLVCGELGSARHLVGHLGVYGVGLHEVVLLLGLVFLGISLLHVHLCERVEVEGSLGFQTVEVLLVCGCGIVEVALLLVSLCDVLESIVAVRLVVGVVVDRLLEHGDSLVIVLLAEMCVAIVEIVALRNLGVGGLVEQCVCSSQCLVVSLEVGEVEERQAVEGRVLGELAVAIL